MPKRCCSADNTAGGREVDDTAAEEAAATLTALDAEGGRTTDPVRMYMREMGTVELLTREGEIAIAKRIEEGLNQMLSSLASFPWSVQPAARGLRTAQGGQEAPGRDRGRLQRPDRRGAGAAGRGRRQQRQGRRRQRRRCRRRHRGRGRSRPDRSRSGRSRAPHGRARRASTPSSRSPTPRTARARSRC